MGVEATLASALWGQIETLQRGLTDSIEEQVRIRENVKQLEVALKRVRLAKSRAVQMKGHVYNLGIDAVWRGSSRDTFDQMLEYTVASPTERLIARIDLLEANIVDEIRKQRENMDVLTKAVSRTQRFIEALTQQAESASAAGSTTSGTEA